MRRLAVQFGIHIVLIFACPYHGHNQCDSHYGAMTRHVKTEASKASFSRAPRTMAHRMERCMQRTQIHFVTPTSSNGQFRTVKDIKRNLFWWFEPDGSVESRMFWHAKHPWREDRTQEMADPPTPAPALCAQVLETQDPADAPATTPARCGDTKRARCPTIARAASAPPTPQKRSRRRTAAADGDVALTPPHEKVGSPGSDAPEFHMLEMSLNDRAALGMAPPAGQPHGMQDTAAGDVDALVVRAHHILDRYNDIDMQGWTRDQLDASRKRWMLLFADVDGVKELLLEGDGIERSRGKDEALQSLLKLRKVLQSFVESKPEQAQQQ